MTDLKDFLDSKVIQYNRLDFIKNDPIQIPHRYQKKQDIEIAGLFAAVLAWGQRITIINKCSELMQLMDNAPHDFVINHTSHDLKSFLDFKHRTFNATDVLYFIHFLKSFYQKNESLEEAFLVPSSQSQQKIAMGLTQFHKLFFSLEDSPSRTQKHIATPARNSACKRLNMYLRWMVRRDNCGVDFGIWHKISPADLICPLDLHVERVARQIGFITRKQTDWQAATELTAHLRQFDPHDPVKYDFALFGLGLEKSSLDDFK
jgi:uncharacterized protein (TIGR02757 family)